MRLKLCSQLAISIVDITLWWVVVEITVGIVSLGLRQSTATYVIVITNVIIITIIIIIAIIIAIIIVNLIVIIVIIFIIIRTRCTRRSQQPLRTL